MRVGGRPTCKNNGTAAQKLVAQLMTPIEQIRRRNVQSTNNDLLRRTHNKEESALFPTGGANKTGDFFISRVRYALRSPPIDIKNSNYRLADLRYFQDIKGQHLHDFASNKYKPLPLGVVSFNVLSQRLKEKTERLYTHLDNDGLRLHGLWEGRMPKLVGEFGRLHPDADIFCLQEVQDCHYEEFYKPYFAEHGYQGFFTPRRGQDTPDGCAVFWCNRLELLHSRHIHYNLSVPAMDKDNCGQILLFRVIGTRTAICISNTHIYYNMNRGEVKLAQMAYLLASMHQMESEIRAEFAAQAAQDGRMSERNCGHFAGHILCGDFNMEPASPLHRFVLNGTVNLAANTRFEMAHQQPQSADQRQQPPAPLCTPSTVLPIPAKEMRLSANCTFAGDPSQVLDIHGKDDQLRHPFNFASVYEYWNALGEEEITTYHSRDSVQRDFIFYSALGQTDIILSGNGLDTRSAISEQQEKLMFDATKRELAHETYIQLRRRLSLLTLSQLKCTCGPMPNEQNGSDHLSLFAQFDLLTVPTNCK